MPTRPVPDRRKFKRDVAHERASIVVNSWERQERFPCLVLDSNQNGFRLRGAFHVRRRQAVEVILDEDPLNTVKCIVVWVGKPGSKQEGEVGLQTI